MEIWLIDFKMTEFSRYTKHIPPHVRYIILDESPELVYDIIDRLTEIMNKRQNVFKGKWQKLGDVPSEKYMPTLLVIIDEFSIMSQIIANSIAAAKENYSEKLQNLLAKGAALGFRFVFSSQGFTSGTRGLSDFSKKQIQQRIAMKTEYNEIRETLDLRSASDEDKSLMEQLPVHYVLVKERREGEANHLKNAKVMFISDYSKQEQMIDSLNKGLLHTEKYYDDKDMLGYIDKKTLVIDGNEYVAFKEKINEFKDCIKKQREMDYEDGMFLFLGTPRKMASIYPIEILEAYLENILVISSDTEQIATMSLVMSINESLVLQNREIEVWASPRNKIYKQMIAKTGYKISEIKKDLGEICEEIRRIKENILNQKEEEKYIVLLGTESLFMDMKFQNDICITSPKKEKEVWDSLTQMAMLQQGKKTEDEEVFDEVDDNVNTIYDARNDFSFILQQGSRIGYHFIVIFNSIEELNQCKLNISHFRHKIMFRNPQNDAAILMRNANPAAIAELESHSFRYTDGLEAVSFRPYLHDGIILDGWSTDQGEKKNMSQEEYLM